MVKEAIQRAWSFLGAGWPKVEFYYTYDNFFVITPRIVINILVAFSLLIAFGLALWKVPAQQVQAQREARLRELYQIKQPDREDLARLDQEIYLLENKIRGNYAQIPGGCLLLAALWLTLRRRTGKEPDSDREWRYVESQNREIEYLLTDIKHFHPMDNQRLNIITRVESIARDSEPNHWPAMEGLCEFIRASGPERMLDGGSGSDDREAARDSRRNEAGRVRHDVQKALNAIRRRKWVGSEESQGLRLNLENADLCGADLSGVCLESANLKGCDLRGANLSGACLDSANLSGVDLSGADLRFASLDGTNLRGAILCDADLSHANLWGTTLDGASLRGACLSDTFIHPSLAGADLTGVDLSRQNLFLVNMRGANLSGANLRWSDMTGIHLENANLTGADLSGSCIVSAHLRGAILSRAILRGAVFYNADLSEADLSEADLSGADITKADLRGASLTRAELSEADLSRSDLRGVRLSEAKLAGADLTDADLSGADLTNADLSGANLTGALIDEGERLPEGVDPGG